MLTLHHTGVVVKDVNEARDYYATCFGFEVKSPVIHDPVQTAYVQFLRLPGNDVYLELVSPDGPASKLSNALSKGRVLNHICYATSDIEGACEHLRSQGLFILQTPVIATAFRPRRIAWLMGKDCVPVELVERGAPREL